MAHFTHYTVAHAHLGLYAFVSFAFFGALYFIVPRVTGREWPYRWMIYMHFWLAAGGIGIYFVFLEHWRLAAGAGHAGRGAPVHGLGGRDPAVPARPLAGRGR